MFFVTTRNKTILKNLISYNMPQEYPYLLLFKEKYSTYHYLVQGPDDPQKIYLSVLTRRFKDGWYNWMKSEKGAIRIRYDMIETVVNGQILNKAGTLIRAQANGEYEGFDQQSIDPF